VRSKAKKSRIPEKPGGITRMKIIIGPYINYWGVYHLFGLLSKVGFSKETTDRWAENSPEWLNQIFLWVETKRKVTRKIVIHPYDTWSMDHTLAYIIKPMLKQLKATKHGIPMSAFEDSDGIDPKYGGPSESAMVLAEARWNLILDKMIWSFERLNDDEEWLDHFKVGEAYNSEAYKAYQEHISEGFRLFGEHYQSLWD
jgi:hypothetical protein